MISPNQLVRYPYLLFLVLLTPSLSTAQSELLQPVVQIEVRKVLAEEVGAGIIAGQKGNTVYILTAHHVIFDKVSDAMVKEIQVQLYELEGYIKATLIDKDEKLDVALLSIQTNEQLQLEHLIPADELIIKEKAKVVSIGHPGGGIWRKNQLNIIQEISVYEDERLFSITPQAVSGGCSGGPVFLENGAWLGMVTETGQVEAKCVKAEVLTEWMQNLGMPDNYIYAPSPDMVFISGEEKVDESFFPEPKGLDYFYHFDYGVIQPESIRPYFLAKKEINVNDFRAFVIAAGYVTDAEKRGIGVALHKSEYESYYVSEVEDVNWKHDVLGNKLEKKDGHLPVVHVSFNDAVAYCRWLSQKTGDQYRLPSMKEWQYAFLPRDSNAQHINCCVGNVMDIVGFEAFYFNQCLSNPPEYSDGFSTLAPSGSFPPNELGLYDLYGNVSEWCRNYYIESWPNRQEKRYGKGPNWLLWFKHLTDDYAYNECGVSIRYFNPEKENQGYYKRKRFYSPSESTCFTGFRLTKDSLTQEDLQVLAQIEAVAALEKELEGTDNFEMALSVTEKQIPALEKIYHTYPGNEMIVRCLSAAYGSLARRYLKTRQYEKAEQAARQGLQIEPEQLWINSYLALALLLQDKFDKAKSIYSVLKDRSFSYDFHPYHFLDSYTYHNHPYDFFDDSETYLLKDIFRRDAGTILGISFPLERYNNLKLEEMHPEARKVLELLEN